MRGLSREQFANLPIRYRDHPDTYGPGYTTYYRGHGGEDDGQHLGATVIHPDTEYTYPHEGDRSGLGWEAELNFAGEEGGGAGEQIPMFVAHSTPAVFEALGGDNHPPKSGSDFAQEVGLHAARRFGDLDVSSLSPGSEGIARQAGYRGYMRNSIEHDFGVTVASTAHRVITGPWARGIRETPRVPVTPENVPPALRHRLGMPESHAPDAGRPHPNHPGQMRLF